MEVSFDASAEELHLSCRQITKMEKKTQKNTPFWSILIHTLQSDVWISSKTRYTQHVTRFSDICSIFADLFGWNTGLPNLRSTFTSTFPHLTLIPTAATLQSWLTFCITLSLFKLVVQCTLWDCWGKAPMAGCPQLGLTSWWGGPFASAHQNLEHPGAPVETCIGMTMPNHWQSLRLEYCFDD